MSENKINFTKAVLDILPLPASGQRKAYHDKKPMASKYASPVQELKHSAFIDVSKMATLNVCYPDMSIEINGVIVRR